MLPANVLRIQSQFSESEQPANNVVVPNEYCEPFVESKRAFFDRADSQVIQ